MANLYKEVLDVVFNYLLMEVAVLAVLVERVVFPAIFVDTGQLFAMFNILSEKEGFLWQNLKSN